MKTLALMIMLVNVSIAMAADRPNVPDKNKLEKIVQSGNNDSIIREFSARNKQQQNYIVELLVKYNNINTLKILFDRGIKPSSSALRMAITNNRFELATFLINNGAPSADPRLLEEAISNESLPIVDLLLQTCATLDAEDNILYGPAKSNNVALVKLLLANGAAPNIREKVQVQDCEFIYRNSGSRRISNTRCGLFLKPIGPTPLYIAIKNGSVEMAKLLLENGADPGIKFVLDGEDVKKPVGLREFAQTVGNAEIAGLMRGNVAPSMPSPGIRSLFGKNCLYEHTIILEGKGADNIIIGKSTYADVIEEYGQHYDALVHYDADTLAVYSYEMNYTTLGLSFYYKDDKRKTIFSIHFRSPFSGETSRGIILGESTMKDVIRIYGEPEWGTSDGSNYWWAEYKGIDFGVKRDTSLPQYPLNKAIHIEKVITEIRMLK
jgi:hypothetical protein